MSEDSPKIVNLEGSLELSEFFSEMDFPSETNLPANGEPSVGPANRPVVIAPNPARKDERLDDSPPAAREKRPRLSLHVEQPVHPSTPPLEQAEPPVPADTPVMEELVESSADLNRNRCARALTLAPRP